MKTVLKILMALLIAGLLLIAGCVGLVIFGNKSYDYWSTEAKKQAEEKGQTNSVVITNPTPITQKPKPSNVAPF